MDIKVTIEAKDLTRALTLMAEAIGYLAAQNPELAKKHAPKPAAAKQETAVEPPPEQPQPELEAPKDISLDDAKQRVATIVQKTGSAPLRDILKDCGCAKLSDATPEQLTEILTRMEAL